MRLELIFPREGLPTCVACVWLLPRVYEHVPLEMVSLAKTLAAHTTCVRLVQRNHTGGLVAPTAL